MGPGQTQIIFAILVELMHLKINKRGTEFQLVRSNMQIIVVNK